VSKKKDFFISYTSNDKDIALWIASVLEESGFSTVIQSWDFRPGNNFILEMQKAAISTNKTLALLSNDYLTSPFTQAEWAAAFSIDPTGEKEVLIPIRIKECTPSGILSNIIYIDLLGLGKEEAKIKLLNELETPRTRKKADFPHENIFLIPHNRNSFFTGRDELLNLISATLNKKNIVSITPKNTVVSGIGKSHLAIEYAYRYSYQYNLICWINSESIISVEQDFVKMYDKIAQSKDSENDINNQMASISSFLKTNKSWLLVFDNVINFDSISKYLPNPVNGHIIITSRKSCIEENIENIKIDTMNDAEAIEYLQKVTRLTDPINAQKLSRMLLNLPLALEQAGFYLKSTGRTFTHYINLFKKNDFNVSERNNSYKYIDIGNVSLNIATEELKSEMPVSIDLLYFLALFAPDNIPIDFFSYKAADTPDDLSGLFKDPLLLDNAICLINNFSLIKCYDNQISIHRLFRSSIQKSLKPEKRINYVKFAGRLLNVRYVFSEENYHTWKSCLSLNEHVASVIAFAKLNKIYTKTLVDLSYNSGYCLRVMQMCDLSENILSYCIDAAQEVLDKNDYQLSLIYNEMGNLFLRRAIILSDLNQITQKEDVEKNEYCYNAISFLEKSLNIAKTANGDKSVSVGVRLNNLAVAYIDLKLFDKAETSLENALEIYEIHGKAYLNEICSTLGNLSVLYHQRRNFTKAIETAKKEISYRIENNNYYSHYNSTGHHNLSIMYSDIKDYNESIKHIKEAISINDVIYSEDNFNTAKCYFQLAECYRMINDKLNAFINYKKCYSIYKDLLGEENQTTKYINSKVEEYQMIMKE